MRTSSPRTRGVVVGVAVVAVAGAVALLGPGGGGTPSASGPGPTVAAERRDLATSLTAAGEVRRSAETVVAHASPPAPGSGEGGGGGGAPGPSALRAPGPSGARATRLGGLYEGRPRDPPLAPRTPGPS